MLVTEYIEVKLTKFGIEVSKTELDAVLIEFSIGVAEEISDIASLKKAKVALASMLPEMLVMANVTEGGYSVNWNIEGIKEYINYLNKQLGLKSTTNPVISNQSFRW